ncbi:MAG: glycoside hydrolase family 2, partial [Pirellulales bacterium]
MTRWAKDVSPASPHSEYPRPQMVRKQWANLNGLWDYAIADKDTEQPKQFAGKILVPFCVESSLSGVARRVTAEQALWYRRTFTVPANWKKQRVLLNF